MRSVLAFCLILALGACADPLAGVDRLSDVDVVDANPATAALPDAEEVAREGFFGTAAAQGASDDSAGDTAASQGGFLRGLFRSDGGSAGRGNAASQGISPSNAAADGAVDIAALPPTGAERQTDAAAPRGLLGLIVGSGSDAPRNGPDARDVPFGTVLAFGEIARVCDGRGKSLGKVVDRQGNRGFTLYDSKPGITDKRTYYVTGFSDRCPRQFTAANALFGRPSFYEQIRFGPAGRHLPYAATDKSYDKLKSRMCGARKKEPCGTKIGRLDRKTAFVSAYEFREHNGQWKEFLVHDGAVLAAALKTLN